MIVVIGDNHFGDHRPWSAEVSNNQIDYILSHPLNTKENTLILTGDLVDIPFMTGKVYSMLLRFFSGLRFKEVYVVQGNHDVKLNRQNELALAYDFLSDPKLLSGAFSAVYPIKELTVKNIEGMEVIMMPFIHTFKGKSIRDYENLPESITDKQYDLCVTHVADTSLNAYPGHLIDLTKINSKYWASGHVHTPDLHYVGSVVPNSSAESGSVRQFRTYTKAGGETIVPIKELLRYETVEFPQDLPKEIAPTTVYTVLNCSDIAIAKQKYGDIYIRKCLPKIALDRESFGETVNLNDGDTLDPVKMFSLWREDAKHPDTILRMCDKYFASI